jgi:hypothetical protein
VRAGGVGLNGQAGGRQGGRAGKRDAQGQVSGAGSIERAGRPRGGEGARGRTWLGWSVGPLGPGDGHLVHHPR